MDDDLIRQAREMLKHFVVFVDLAVDCWSDCPYPEPYRRRVSEARALIAELEKRNG
jgi:hypothetical protein